MNLLFDFLSTQDSINGGAEYALRVFGTLQSRDNDIEYYCLFDKNRKIAYEKYSPENLPKSFHHIHVVFFDSLTMTPNFGQLVEKYHIDEIYIAIHGRYFGMCFDNISCPVRITMHDAGQIEFVDCHLYEYLHTYNPEPSFKTALHLFVNRYILGRRPTPMDTYDLPFFREIEKLKKLHIIFVSKYSQNSVLLYSRMKNVKTSVLYSPQKITFRNEQIENSVLDTLINSKSKFFVMVSADRELKNPKKAIEAFLGYKEMNHNNLKLVTFGYKGAPLSKDHISLPYVSTSDLENAYMHCYALFYPTLFEGFGYPPLEAMKYGKPVLASNVTSVPEILGDSVVYFSPFYKADMVKAMLELDAHYEEYAEKAIARYKEVSAKQNVDLIKLCELLENPEIA